MSSRPCPVLALSLTLALTAGLLSCAGSPDDSATPTRATKGATPAPGETTGSSIWDRLAEERRRKQEGRGEATTALDAGAADLDPALRAQMEEWWEALLARDRTRSERLASLIAGRGEAGRRLLVENRIRYYVLAREKGVASEWRYIQSRLEKDPDLTAEYLVPGLARGLGDSAARNWVGDLLAYIGEGTLPRIERALPDASETGRAALARVLKIMGSPRSMPLLLDLAEARYPFTVRIEAIETLARIGGPRAIPVLREGLSDRDPSVRKWCARHAWRPEIPDRGLLLALVDCLVASEEAGGPEYDTARACHVSLRRLLGRRARDAAGWRRLIAERRDG